MAASIGYVGFAALAVIVFLIRRIITIELGPGEPPLLRPRVPLIGHILGLIKHESDYFSILRSRTNAPVITLPMLNKKNYIIFSPHLAQQGFKHHNLDFDLIGLAFARQVASISDQANTILQARLSPVLHKGRHILILIQPIFKIGS